MCTKEALKGQRKSKRGSVAPHVSPSEVWETPPLNSSQPGGGRAGPADRPDEALGSDLHS